jgi:copper chaperone
MEEKTVFIPNINCGHCAMTIKREIGELDGVDSVEVDIAAKTAHIRWSAPADWAKIRDALEEIGFPPGE